MRDNLKIFGLIVIGLVLNVAAAFVARADEAPPNQVSIANLENSGRLKIYPKN